MHAITVIIPCYNAEPWIGEALTSVVDQGIENLEIIVVDDGSTDAGAAIVRQEFPQAQLIQTSNQGPAAARNVGTSRAKGDFLQYLDADDLLMPGKLRIQREALNRTGADVAYGDWRRLRRQPNGYYAPAEVVSRRLNGTPELELFGDFWCPPAAYLFRRSLVEKIGGWNERLPVIQDARFALDCALHGGQFVYCPGVMCQYRTHVDGSVSTRNKAAFNRDCFINAKEVEAWWTGNGGLTPDRRAAVLKVYAQTARGSFRKDPETFEATCRELERLSPGYVPREPWQLAAAAKLLGYRRAETVAYFYRRCMGLLRRTSPR